MIQNHFDLLKMLRTGDIFSHQNLAKKFQSVKIDGILKHSREQFSYLTIHYLRS